MLDLVKRKHGFTLIEILVVISIIGIVSGIGLVSYGGITVHARDVARKQSLLGLKAALELYWAKEGTYIGGSGTCDGTVVTNFPEMILPYLTGDLPKDPKTGQAYCYEPLHDGSDYYLYAKLENCSDPEIINQADCASAKYNFRLTSGEYVMTNRASAPGPTDEPISTVAPSPNPTSTPTPSAVPTPSPTPTPPPNNTVAPPGQDVCTWQSNNFIQVYVFNDPNYNPALWPKLCGGGSADYCAYPNRAGGHPLYSFRDRIGEQGIQNEERPQDGYQGLITVHLRSDICGINLTAYQTNSITYGLANATFGGRVVFNVPGLVGRQSSQVTAPLYDLWIEVPNGKNFTRGTCYINFGEQTNLVQGRSGGDFRECGSKFRLNGASVGGVATFGIL